VDGGGIDNNGGTVIVRNTILAGNTVSVGSGPDLNGVLTSLGHDLIGNTNGASGFVASDLLNVNPLLGQLQDNGGPTQTMAPLPGSPAVDAGDNIDAPDFDQRGPGFPRIVGGAMDIGALEVQPGSASHFRITAPSQVTSNAPFEITITALDNYEHTAVGYRGTLAFSSSDTAAGVLLPPNYVFTAADKGVHGFANGVRLLTPGSQTLTAADAFLPSISGSVFVIVTPPVFTVTNTLDRGPGSLRQAILDADATPGPDIIRFAIGTGIRTINLASPLPAITQPMVIDGTSQPGYTGTPMIELNGAGAGPDADGLRIIAGSSLVRGLIINRFSLYGIELQNSGGNVIQGDYIGTDVTGSIALSNRIGVRVSSSNNTIGGTTVGAGNVISGNLSDGLFISDNGTGNLVQGNFIGTDASGTLILGNGNNGVHLLNGYDNAIGGTAAGAANVIAYNGNDGVLVDGGTENLISQNSIFGHANGLGIELANLGNNNLSFPVLTSAITDGFTTMVNGLIQSAPNTTFTLEFFANPVSNPSGFGEGKQFLGASAVTTDSSGTASFSVLLASPGSPGQFVAATATDPNSDTSAFSQCIGVIGPGAPLAPLPGTQQPSITETIMSASLAPPIVSRGWSADMASAQTEWLLASTDRLWQQRAIDILFGKHQGTPLWQDEIAPAGFSSSSLAATPISAPVLFMLQ
jgi:hypothetical protein